MKRHIVGAIIAAGAILLMVQSGAYLVVDHPEKSDAIIVLAGDRNDTRYWRGIDMLRAGYGRQMIVDASTERMYGRTNAEHAADFVARTSGELAPQISVCTVKNDSTVLETTDVAGCLARLQPLPHKALLITSDFHTRRAVSIFGKRLPQYHWSVAAAHDDSFFGQPWWKKREWAKINITEWQKLLWWELWERWRS
jgi:uncharacterized SAM-binding protein YcdF (DUF218 family)